MPQENLGRELAALSTARIYLGHQSVGENVLRGLRGLAREAGASSLTFTELGDNPVPTGAAVLDSFVGENGRPDTKLRDFEQALDRLAPTPVDVALLKFCYIDISADSDVERLFEQYRNLLSRLRIRYPHTSFVPVTVPLKAGEGLKGVAKRWLRGTDPDAENVRRNAYNELVRAHYRWEPIFDLARVESVRPDGSPERFGMGGRQYEQLAAALTSDGGHLNQAGGVAAARELVHVLAGVLAARATADAGAPPRRSLAP